MKEYSITNECTVHLVKGKTAAASGSAPTMGTSAGATG